MGQEEGRPKDLISQQFNIVRTISPGEFWVRRKRKGDQLQLRILTFYLQDEMQEYMKYLDRRKKIRNPHLLELIEHTQVSQQTMCSVAFKIRTLVQYPFKTIKDEIEQRASVHPKRYFSEDEMWSILYSCCHALYTLYLNNFNHEALSTSYIFIDTAGIIKIADNVLVNCEKNHLSLLNESSTQPTVRYISPELVNLVEDNHFYFYEKEKSDVYILALIMLQIGNLEPVRYYNKKSKKFSFEEPNKALDQAQNRYSIQLNELLQTMLTLDFKQRPRFQDIITSIQQKTIYTESSSAAKSFLTNETKSHKVTTTNLKTHREQGSNLKSQEYKKHSRNLSQPSSGLAKVQQHKKLAQFNPNIPQYIQLKNPLSFTETVANGTELRAEAIVQTKEVKALPEPNQKKTREGSKQKKAQGRKLDTNLKNTSQKNQECYTPYLQLLHLTQKTIGNPNKPLGSFNVTKVETVVSQPSEKPKIFIKYDQSPNKNQNNQPLMQHIQLHNKSNSKFSEAKFGAIQLPNRSLTNPNQQMVNPKKQPLNTQIKPLDSLPPNPGAIFVIEQTNEGKFEGFKVNNKRNGMGKFIYLNGSYYEGQWKDDTIDGLGKMYYNNGKIAYEGHWRNFTFQGTGKLYNEDTTLNHNAPIDYMDLSCIDSNWVSYEGQFEHDEKQGKGTLFFANGQKFIGFFMKDAAQGQGCYYKQNGEVIKGKWSQNLLIEGP